MDGRIEGRRKGCLRVVARHGGWFFLGRLTVARDEEKAEGTEFGKQSSVGRRRKVRCRSERWISKFMLHATENAGKYVTVSRF